MGDIKWINTKYIDKSDLPENNQIYLAILTDGKEKYINYIEYFCGWNTKLKVLAYAKLNFLHM